MALEDFVFFCEEEFEAKVTGIDSSNIMIEHANKVVKIKNSKCKFILGNYNNLQQLGGHLFDVVIFPNNIVECSYAEFENICEQVKKF